MLLNFVIVGIFMQISYGIGPFLLPLGIKDKPFKGEFEKVTSKKLPTGEFAHNTARIKIYRDSNGSVRFENFEKKNEEDKIYSISIYNHNEQKIYFLDVDSKIFYAMPAFDSNKESDSKPESLTYLDKDIGLKTIDNLICRGYQRKQKENDVLEYWVSEEIDQIIRAKSIFGNEINTLRLFDIKRLKTDSRMFVVPSDYKPAKIE
ncbi:hypothetical protein BH20ACI4_BH20ACI4_09420 [soil metagenome]